LRRGRKLKLMSKCEPRVKQIGNHITTGNFNNPQRGRVYDTSGIAPACNCCEGGAERHRFWNVIWNK